MLGDAEMSIIFDACAANTLQLGRLLLIFVQLFDVDGNGRNDKIELSHILKTFGEKFDQKDINELFKIFDVNNDGSIDYMGKSLAESLAL